MKMIRAASFFCLLAGLSVPGFAGNRSPRPFVIQPDKFMASQPLSETLKTTPPPVFHGWIEREENAPRHLTKIYNLPDPVIQESSGNLPELGVTIGLNFDGLYAKESGGVAPPDTNGAAGDKQFFLITNFAFQIFDKTTGKAETQPALIHTIWGSQFGGQCGTQDNGDPIVLYDHMANRWLVEQLNFFTDFQICIAVSQTDDATGKYNLYAYTFQGLTDYPKLSVWPDAYYLAFNFLNSLGEAGEPCALDRKAMISGKQKPAMICFPPNSADFGFLPSDVDGSAMPPKGAPNHYVELGNSNVAVNEFDFHVDFKNPKRSTFKGPHTITVPAYTQICGGGGGACIPQPGVKALLDANGDRLIFRNAYRNLGDHEAMVFSHAVAPGQGSSAVSAERWYELRSTPPGGSFKLYQAGTYQNKKDNYWEGSAAMDKNGDIALGFSVDNGTNLYPSIWLTGRVPSDPLNKMESHAVAHKGSTAQSPSNRWGDYSSMSVDPSDDCTMWYTQEYVRSDGGEDWQAHVVSFKFDSCQ